MTPTQLQLIALTEYASQKLREEFDASKHFWEQESILESALRMGLTEIHEEMKADMKVGVSDLREDKRQYMIGSGWPKF